MYSGLKPLILIALISGLFCQSPAYSASQKVDPMTRMSDIDRALSSGGMEMTRSTKERMLNNFKTERQELYKNRAKEPHLFKNRLKILTGKIDFLEKELKRSKPTTKKAIAAKPITPSAVQTVKPKPAPAVVRANPKLKGYAPMADRKRYFLAMKSNIVALKPSTDPDKREGPIEAHIPVKTEIAKPVEAAPIHVAIQPPSPIEKRQDPQKEALPPVKIEPQVSAAVSARSQAEEHPLPPVPEAPVHPEVVKLKNKALKIGSDWEGMSRPDKEIYILSVMGNLSRRDVYLMKPYSFYIQSIDEAIKQNPDLGEEYVHRILMMTAYESEPDTRKDLEKVWK